MVLLTKFGVVNTVKMKLYRKWAFLGTFLLAAVLTPPDIITQVLLAFPLYGLYEFGVVVSRFFEDPKNRELAFKQMQAEAAAKKVATFFAAASACICLNANSRFLGSSKNRDTTTPNSYKPYSGNANSTCVIISGGVKTAASKNVPRNAHLRYNFILTVLTTPNLVNKTIMSGV